MNKLFNINFSMTLNPDFHLSEKIKWMILLLVMVLTGLMFIPFSPRMPAYGFDPSWVYATDQAVELGMIFGRDFIYTVGPYSNLIMKSYSPGTDLLMLLTSAFFIIGLMISVYLSIPKYSRWWLLIFPLVFVMLLILSDALLIGFPFLFLLAVARITQPPSSSVYLPATPMIIAALGVSTCAIGMIPLIKGSLIGSMLPVCGLAFILLWFHCRRMALCFVGLLLISICVNWIISGQELENIIYYFYGMSQIVSGYTNAMSLRGSNVSIIYFVLASVLIIFLFSRIIISTFGRQGWVIVAGMVLIWFIAFKAGFVRQDGHVYIALEVLLLLTYVASYIRLGTKNLRSGGIVLCMWLVALSAWSVVRESDVHITPGYIINKLSHDLDRTLSGIKERIFYPERLMERYEQAKESIRRKHPLPLPISGTVDLYPYELSTVFAHDLNWSGRPVPQSSSAYTTWLDKINAQHLRSEKAADTIFLKFGAIDNRFPAGEDAGSVLELLAGYAVSGYYPPYAILNRHENTASAALDHANKTLLHVKFGQIVPLESTRPLWLQANIRPTFLGKLVLLLFKLPQLQIELTLDGGEVVQHRFIPNFSERGFIVSPYMRDAKEFIALAAGVDMNKVKSIRFISNRMGLWREDIDLTITPLDVVPQQGAKNIFSTQIFTRPVEAMDILDSDRKESANCVIDYVNGKLYQGQQNIRTKNGFLQLQGWTAPNRENDDGLPITAYAVVSSVDGEQIYFKGNIINRSDVARHFNRPGLDMSGYDLNLDLSDFEGEKTIQIKSISGGIAYDCPFLLNIE